MAMLLSTKNLNLMNEKQSVKDEKQSAKDENEILQIIKDMTSLENNKPKGREHMDNNCLMIRPTGNPLNMEAWDAMINSNNVTLTHSKLVSVNKLIVEGNMAYACYTSHSVFNYKGTDNDDISVFTGVFQKLGGVWKLVHGHRSTGRGPNEPLPQF
jgi:ketosteroid isomerase-like protein